MPPRQLSSPSRGSSRVPTPGSSPRFWAGGGNPRGTNLPRGWARQSNVCPRVQGSWASPTPGSHVFRWPRPSRHPCLHRGSAAGSRARHAARRGTGCHAAARRGRRLAGVGGVREGRGYGCGPRRLCPPRRGSHPDALNLPPAGARPAGWRNSRHGQPLAAAPLALPPP